MEPQAEIHSKYIASFAYIQIFNLNLLSSNKT